MGNRAPCSKPSRKDGAGLYLHVPFCSAVCPYCDFAVLVAKADAKAAFVQSLEAEIALNNDWPVPFDTVYFGGGTPSCLSAEQLHRLLETASTHLPFALEPQVFMEANPEDVNPTCLEQWRRLGVNTLSLGVQSFVDEELKRLGRRHNAEQAICAVEQALAAGFGTVSVDLIFGLPKQDKTCLQESLNQIIALAPPHVSCYQLTVHERTTFGRWRDRGKLVELSSHHQADFFAYIHDMLAKTGYEAYDVSNFAIAPAHRSRHNLKYWQHTPYLGLGPSAHSFDGQRRWWNVRDLSAYQRSIHHENRRPLAAWEDLSPQELALECVMLGLRTTGGLDLKRFEKRYGICLLATNEALVHNLLAENLLSIENEYLKPTVRGLAVADGLAVRFCLDAVTA